MIKNIVNQRFIDCVNFLIKTKKAPSKSFLAEKFNISTSKFSEILNKRMNVGIDLLIVLASDFNISSDWLLTGEGSMLKNPEVVVSSSQPQENDKYTEALEKQIALLEKNNALLEDKITHLEHRLELAELKDKEAMSLKIKKQRKEIDYKDEIINLQNEELDAMKSISLPPDKPLRPSKKV